MAVIVGQGISVSPVADAELSHESTSTVQNKVVTDAIASEYSTSKTYSVGDVCTHDGKLYECIVDIPTAEGWTLSHWKVSNLGDNVSNLNRQLNDETTGLDTKAPVILETASGAIASFTDGANGMPIKKLVAQIEPVQDLHGYDHPWPAGGGKNLFDPQKIVDAGGSFDGTKYIATQAVFENTSLSDITFDADTQYYFFAHGKVTSSNASALMRIIVTYTDSTEQAMILVGATEADRDGTSTSGKTIASIRFAAYASTSTDTTEFTKFMICKASAGTAYAPYENICPISGHTGAEIEQAGVNLWDEQWEVGQIDPYTGEPTSANDRIRSKNYIRLEPSTTFYAVSDGMGSNDFRMCFYDKYKNFIAVGSWQYSSTFTTPDNAYYGKFVRVNTTTYNNNISINYPATDTTYHPYTGNQISVTFPETIYGGEDEVISGKLKSTMGMVDLGSLNYTDYGSGIFRCSDIAGLAESGDTMQIISSMFRVDMNLLTNKTNGTMVKSSSTAQIYFVYTDAKNAAEMKAAMSGVQLCYELAEPVEYTLTGNEMDTLYGTNNIWSSTGDTEVTYPADTKLYIEKLTQPEEDDMMANANIAANTFFMIGNTLYFSTAAIAQGATIIPGTNCNVVSLADALNQLNT